MSMNPCNNCLENTWTFEQLEENYVRATCNMCGHEVEWETVKKKKSYKNNDKCKKCLKGRLYLKEAKITPKKLKKAYYYTAYYQCNKCRKMFFIDKFKIINK